MCNKRVDKTRLETCKSLGLEDWGDLGDIPFELQAWKFIAFFDMLLLLTPITFGYKSMSKENSSPNMLARLSLKVFFYMEKSTAREYWWLHWKVNASMVLEKNEPVSPKWYIDRYMTLHCINDEWDISISPHLSRDISKRMLLNEGQSAKWLEGISPSCNLSTYYLKRISMSIWLTLYSH